MISNGTQIRMDSGKMIQIGDPLPKQGAQARVFWATDKKTKAKGVFKEFLPDARRDTARRIRFLVDAQAELKVSCLALNPPTDGVTTNYLGHFAPAAPGTSLEDMLSNPSASLLDHIQLAVGVVQAVHVLHERNIAHGDLHGENFLVHRNGSVMELSVIDLDNFNSPGQPPPPCYGHAFYIAPEVRDSLAKRRAPAPDIASDRFSLAVVMHEILFLRHPAAGADGDQKSFDTAMCSGRWHQDPADGPVATNVLGGYPTEVVNADLMRLFRVGFSRDPLERPAAAAWLVALRHALNNVYPCPRCGGLSLADCSKTICPHCKKAYPYLSLRLSSGETIPLEAATTVVGRDQLGGSPKVSTRHAIIHHVGPDTTLISIGRNGTFRWGSNWCRLPDNKPILIQKGDRLRFADVEIDVL